MIFVTVGSAEKGMEFERLVEKMDQIAGVISEPVIFQIGSASYVPKNAQFFRYIPYGEMFEYFWKAKVVVGHCGCGTVIQTLEVGTPLIVVPRRAALGEHDRDDHQMILAKRLETHQGVRVVYDIEDLESAVREMLRYPKERMKGLVMSGRASLISEIRSFIEKLAAQAE
jgi:UDP-N-acetylglucosamine transferase subunit ALG13